ncbi:MAG: peptidoglycan-associated lipoprotein Pal [Sphingomonadaceae bacterium]
MSFSQGRTIEMNSLLLKAASAAALVALASGCAKKKPDELPPPPMAEAPPPDATADPYAYEDDGVATTGLDAGAQDALIRAAGSDRVFFDTDSYALDAEDRATLDAQAEWLLANPVVTVTIEGHADERGTREYNLALGDRRANAAKNYLAARGVPASRMTTISWGKERPVAEGSYEAAWAQNRRAVTVIVN